MAHPFQKMFIKALNQSDAIDNLVTNEAAKLIKKGYSPAEVYDVLLKLQKSLIEDKDRLLVAETIEELSLSDSLPDDE